MDFSQLTDPADLGLDAAALERLTPWMQSYVDDQKYPGSSLAILRGGKLVYAQAVGLRDVERQLAFELDTLVRIYSMTKPIVSLALMQLVERGICTLGDPVGDYIPAFKRMQALVEGATKIDQTEPSRSPTLHELLTHTSGLSYGFNTGPLARAMTKQEVHFSPALNDLAGMCDRLAQLPLGFQPSTRWQYAVGIDVIGRGIEILTGQDLESYLIENIFGPLGMDETRFQVPDHARERFASSYISVQSLADRYPKTQKLRLNEDAQESVFLTPGMASGGGGLVGTLSDYIRFAEMLRQGGMLDGQRVIAPRTLAFMMRNHLPGDMASMGADSFAEMDMRGNGFGIGGGVVMQPERSGIPASVGEYSWGGIASTYFWVDPALDMSVVYFTQLMPAGTFPSREQLKALVHAAVR